MTGLINGENLEQLTVEIKFYVQQWGQNTIEIGKRLIAAKKLVEHGDWSKWLADNFNLTDRDEVAKYKAEIAAEKSKTENLFHDNENLKSENERLGKVHESLIDTLDGARKNIDKLTVEKNSLEEQLKNQEP